MLKARLSKDSLRVLCGVKDCRGQLAWVLLEGGGHVIGRCVWFGPGWATRGDGVWNLTRRAIRRKRQGKRPANRGEPGDFIALRPPNYGKRPTGWTISLPVEAICPDCGFRQVLDPDVLKVGVSDGLPWPPKVPRPLVTAGELERWRVAHRVIDKP